MMHRTLAAVVACAAPAAIAHAQAFNLDFGIAGGVPNLGYTGASSQGGIWTIPTTDGNVIDFPNVFDNTFTPTGVHFTSSRALDWDGDPGFGTSQGLSGLMGDGIVIGGASRPELLGNTGPVSLVFANMQNGAYEVYVYTWSVLDQSSRVEVLIGDEVRIGGGEAALDDFFTEGLTHTRHDVVIESGTLEIDLSVLTGGRALVNGIQIVPVPTPGVVLLGAGSVVLLAGRRSRRRPCVQGPRA